ncbi:MAG: acyl-CoA synthetase [Deltaproteobacteria bacterium]|nr:acyl-CoA synthetase [Deltaproteobacteria bacterium]
MGLGYWYVRFRGWLAARPFERACRDPEAAQAKVLQTILRDNGRSSFGADHSFSELGSYEDFKQRVPIRDYEAHRPYVEQILEGNLTALTSEAPFMFGSTSGTTNKPKWVPINKRWYRQLASNVRVWLTRAIMSHSRALDGKVLTVVSPAVEEYAPSGMPIGSASGLTNSRVPWLIRRTYAIPYEVAEIADYEQRYFAIARLGAESNVTMVITPNPSTLSRIADEMRAHADRIIASIRTGALGIDVAGLSGPQRKLLEGIDSKLKPNPKRADVLQQALDREGTLLPKHCWGRLALIGCWLGGSAGVHARALLKSFGEVALRDLGLRATEGTFSIPLADGVADGVLALHSNFYEFIPVDEIESDSPRTLLAHELTLGAQYYLVITTFGGLYRYDMNDVVEICGYHEKAPMIRFMRKGRDMVSIVGEKLHVNQALAAGRHAISATGLDWVQFRLLPDEEGSKHLLLVEFVQERLSPEERERFIEAFDAGLMEANPEYPSKRKSDRLGRPELIPMKAGWADGQRQWDVQQGKRDVQYKWKYIDVAWDDHSRGCVLESDDSVALA